MVTEAAPKTIYRKEYKPPAFLAPAVELEIDLDANAEQESIVKSKVTYVKNPDGPGGDLKLDGEKKPACMRLVDVNINGKPISDYVLEDHNLIIPEKHLPGETEVEITTAVKPHENKAFQGLYKSSGKFFCTQMEAEGFRNMTYFQDRPDVMSKYKVNITAPKEGFPWLLSNGNLIESGDLPNNRHFAKWEDPWPKPCYLFAVVAGDLAMKQDKFITKSGNEVTLRIFVEHGKENQVHHAMESLKRAFKWDEDTFGLEYDLNLFNIVAVSDFNMGAMENKSLNVFHTKYVLANEKTGTDCDFAWIENVIGHEYFHNYTGNRVTLRDWFQLTLKEGLTVFRDQEFACDMNGRIGKRCDDVNTIRSHQFKEDRGPMRHPVRPDSYIAMDNFYTSTVYNKGAEVVRMYQSILGKDGFRKGMDLYFERHDGSAVTCDDFCKAMGDANDKDFSQFLSSWYCQFGTPTVTVKQSYDDANQKYTLSFDQKGASDEQNPFIIPVRIALFSPSTGKTIPLKVSQDGGEVKDLGEETTLVLTNASHTFTFEGVASGQGEDSNKRAKTSVMPIPSIFRDFSAPVKVDFAQRTDDDLRFLMANDTDPFNRWDSAQVLLTRALASRVQDPEPIKDDILEALRKTLEDYAVDAKLRAMVVMMPTEATIADGLEKLNPHKVHEARRNAVKDIADGLYEDFLASYKDLSKVHFDPRQPTLKSGARALKNVCLNYMCKVRDGAKRKASLQLAAEQFENAPNMTDQFSALSCIVNSDDAVLREKILNQFYEQWKGEELVVIKFFSVQAASGFGDSRGDALAVIKALLQHEQFDMKVPAKASSVLNTMANFNICFHEKNGEGYKLLADKILEADEFNGHTSARMAKTLQHWKRYEEPYSSLMKEQLQRISDKAQTNDLKEVASVGLGA